MQVRQKQLPKPWWIRTAVYAVSTLSDEVSTSFSAFTNLKLNYTLFDKWKVLDSFQMIII